MNDLNDNYSFTADQAVSPYGETPPSGVFVLGATPRQLKSKKIEYVPAAEGGTLVMNTEEFEKFEKCMATPTTTAPGMVAAAGEMLLFSKQFRR